MQPMVKFEEFKKFFMTCFIGALVAAAAVAVFTVLTGDFNEVTMKVFLTLGAVVIHSLVCLTFIWDDTKRNTFNSLVFFANVVFLLLVISFVLSVFGIWNIMNPLAVEKAYQSLFYVGFAALHANMLMKALKMESMTDTIIYVNFLFIVLVLGMILTSVNFPEVVAPMGEMYYRVLAAAGIIDGTLTILTIIFYKMYISKHPEKAAVMTGPTIFSARRSIGYWGYVLVLYLLLQMIVPLVHVFGGRGFGF